MIESLAEVDELRSEIARHHVDFQKISEICQRWAERDVDPVTALRQIRNIVG